MKPDRPGVRSPVARAWAAKLGAWRPSWLQVAAAYALAFLACWLSLALGLAQRSSRILVSPLYALLLLFEEELRRALAPAPALHPPLTAPSLASFPLLLAVAIAALPFAAGVALLRSRRNSVRLAGLALLALLAFATFSWTRVAAPAHPGLLLPPVLLPASPFFTMPF